MNQKIVNIGIAIIQWTIGLIVVFLAIPLSKSNSAVFWIEMLFVLTLVVYGILNFTGHRLHLKISIEKKEKKDKVKVLSKKEPNIPDYVG